MKKTLLALALGSMAASSFAYVNLFTSADGRSYISVGADVRAVFAYQDRETGLYNYRTEGDSYAKTFAFRPRFTLSGKAWLNPTTNIGFHARVGANWFSTHGATNNTTAAGTRVGGAYSHYFLGRKGYAYSSNGVTRFNTHSVTDPRFERLYVYAENFTYGKLTIAPGLTGVYSQEQGAADQNDFGTSTNYVYTPYSALSDTYLAYADWTVRYDLTGDPNKKYRFAISSSAARSSNTYSDGNYKFARDIQASFGWKFDRQNAVYLNFATNRTLNGSSTFTGYSRQYAVELFADFQPVTDLRVRTNVSYSRQNNARWTNPNYGASLGLDVIYYGAFVKGLNLYGGYIYKYQKTNYNASTGLFRYTKENVAYLGGDYWLYDSRSGDKFSLKYFAEVSYLKATQSNNTGSTANRGTDNEIKEVVGATGFRLFY
ncbi:hypothetical protein CKF54_02020 [Psittacicella hinzii]|uniref:Porin n=1 Tax=Psittacicella hinzii TaxID=2028575 RepID=A0A3A1Y8A6_9GAMM|nr:hypothetical protein [Psittacicella hinzii]RIY33885.1 hypothetical protein CKF54_02020 [Psittacicella hinzii]